MLISFIVFAAIALPFLILAAAWWKKERGIFAYTLPTMSALLLVAAFQHGLKVVLLGPDYSDRLFFSIGLNMFISNFTGAYLVSTRKWVAAVAALILALDWLLVAAINSAV
ncbi:MAG: hypothetical protein WCE61_14130 [Candidatus Acidiferrum sp.]